MARGNSQPELAPPGVSAHFTRLTASGPAGTHEGQDERNRAQLAGVDEAVRLLAMAQALEDDLGKPVLSASSAMMWHALRVAGVRAPRPGYGRLLAG
jgi:hypothetical protein